MKIWVQPDDGAGPLLSALNRARKSIQVVIFRLDHPAILNALKAAVSRGVAVHALIAHREGNKSLQKLEQTLLQSGVSVAWSGDHWIRYHGKMLIIDGRVVHISAYNYTRLDIEESRSFAIATANRKLVTEASKLFEADLTRQPYVPGNTHFVVSPENARTVLSSFIRGARKQLWIYDTRLSDRRMIRLLKDRLAAGVDVRVIGRLATGVAGLEAQKFQGKRLHTRVIIRDSQQVFLGSQSLRKLELDSRREIGAIVRDPQVVKRIGSTFESDWAMTDAGKRDKEKEKSEKEPVKDADKEKEKEKEKAKAKEKEKEKDKDKDKDRNKEKDRDKDLEHRAEVA